MPNATLPAEIGVAEIRGIFNQVEKEGSNRERELMDAARQIMLDEELLDALHIKYEELDTDFRRTEYATESSFDKLKLFGERNEEIVGEVATVEAELPLLSSSIRKYPTAGGALSAQDIFSQLERLSQRHAFLMEAVRRLDDDGSGREAASVHSHEKVKRLPVDPVLLKISEGRVIQGNLEWELSEMEDKLRDSGS
ncbi:hypothetical protein BV898_06793 [Hypsibius exemplaris]|uniref:Uncharacterized protein n=1 Tax=Hypsibius exemplaris TaxID=2072580 RepID=A0A1W0WVD3_HYPEX|nr:hypothetical protein BV898_06793 [Hypsibius exemplaris]